MSLTPILPGQVGTVVSRLVMTQRPTPKPVPPTPLRIWRPEEVDPRFYKALFHRVGSPWLWYSRLAMTDEALRAAIGELYVVEDRRGTEVGMVELEREGALTRIRFLGLIPPLAGKGHGKWLIGQALTFAWGKETERVELFTCTLDHPAALEAYRKAGFEVAGRSFESFADPRLTGLLPRDCAPQIPIVE